MPIAITKYRCQFKCGHRAVFSKTQMIDHENRLCVKNPANKSCATCSNAIYGKDGDGFRTWHYRECKITILNDFIDSIHDQLNVGGVNHIKPLFKCPNHNLQTEHPDTKSFIEQLALKFAGKVSNIETESIPF